MRQFKVQVHFVVLGLLLLITMLAAMDASDNVNLSKSFETLSIQSYLSSQVIK